ncbi:MAG: DUF2070 family protein [Candidatus Bathyarchaeia archaeon]
MASTKSLDYWIERAVKHYSSLFVLPPYPKIVLLTFVLCMAGSILAIFLVANASLIIALQFGMILYVLSIISDFIVRQGFMKSDLVYDARRCAALSMFSISLWIGFLLVGSLLARFNSWSFWVDLFIMGFAAVCILRLIVFLSTSFVSSCKVVGASLTQPLFCLLSMFYVSFLVGYSFDITIIVLVLLSSVTISLITAFVFISMVNQVGAETFQIPTSTVLRAFLANWMENLTAPLESLFEKFGKEEAIDFSLLAFKSEGKIKYVNVVSSFHPGPFRNIGSSLLPSMTQGALEKKLNCVVAVPHGLFGHEFDLSSQQQNRKVLESILRSTDFAKFDSRVTGFVRIQKDVASASCQIFGDCAVVTLTLAPKTTEDFPQEIGDFIVEEASRLGLSHVVIINAHNSVNSPFNVNSVIAALKDAAQDALQKASKLKPSSFEIGAAKVVPKEFSFEDGMGPGGICALVVKTNGQTCAYITIDGNNMVSGLREKILGAMKKLGVDEGELFTTDTHVVNAIILTARGYNPIGEAIPHEKLINYIKQAVMEALDNIEPALAAWQVGQVPNVKVIGEKQIEGMSLLAERAVQRAKRTAIPLFTVAGLLLTGLLIVL